MSELTAAIESAGRGRERAGRVTLQAVHFRHTPVGPELLAGITLELVAGELVALVGPQGSGKTSLLRLVQGDLAPTAGALRLDGLTLAQMGRRRWAAAIGTLVAGAPLGVGSIADNIGLRATRPDPRRLAEAAARAQLKGDIEALPLGVSTPLDGLDEARCAVLGPRLLLARALYGRPRLLLVDDTAGGLLDEARRIWWQALCELRLTRLVATHRQEIIAGADRVIVLGEGRVQQDLRRSGGSVPRVR